MAAFNGRRAPNVSQYIANLNTIPPVNDMPAQQDFSILDDDLALFTNTEFFDFDMNGPVPDLQQNMKFDASRQGQNLGQEAGNNNMNFANPKPNMSFNDFTWMQQQQQQQHPRAASIHSGGQRSLPPSPPNGIPLANAGQQSQPTLPSAFHFAQIQSGPQVGDKRTSSAALLSPPNGELFEEGSRVAAEEDKRRRNTAASARFRVKKKQREQALEKTAKDMSDKVALLEARVGQLEMENQWLKGLITEKNLKAAEKEKERAESEDEDRVAKPKKKAKTVVVDDLSEADVAEDAERSLDEKKRGVGTEAAAVEA